jgi:hypothetical protein
MIHCVRLRQDIRVRVLGGERHATRGMATDRPEGLVLCS